MDQPAKSLLKYKNSELITTHRDTESPKDQSQKSNDNDPNLASPQSGSWDVLNAILSPRQWMVGDQLWMQEVSTAASTRTDVIQLVGELDKELHQRQARLTGICQVRRELYPQCFDEIIRQVTINCAERGLLLLRIKKEYEMTLNTYQVLHEVSVAFGTRREIQAEQDGADMKKRISALEEESDDLKKQLNEEKARCVDLEKREKDKAQLQKKMHSEEIEVLKKSIQQFNVQLACIKPE